MTQNEIIRSYAQKRLDNLVDYSARRREWYQEQNLRLADRQSDQISLISTISATILAIVAVFPSTGTSTIVKTSNWINYSFIFLILTVILGLGLILWLKDFNERVLDKDRKDEISILDELKKSSQQLVSNPTPSEYLKHIQVFNEQSNKITQVVNKKICEKVALNILYFFILITFVSGVLSLIISRFW